MRGGRRGFSLIELLIVLTVMSLLLGLALPQYRMLRSRAVAAQAIGATQVVRNAAYAHMEATGRWPDDAATGDVPAALVRFLPEGFQFTHSGFSIAWRHSSWSTPTGEQSAQMTQVRTDDASVCDAMNRLLGGNRNQDLLAACDGTTGMVTQYYDN